MLTEEEKQRRRQQLEQKRNLISTPTSPKIDHVNNGNETMVDLFDYY